MGLFQLLNPKQNKVKLLGWAFQNVGQFWFVNWDYLILIQRCKNLQSLPQNVGSFGFLNLDYFENFKQHTDSLKFCKNKKFKILKKFKNWKLEKFEYSLLLI